MARHDHHGYVETALGRSIPDDTITMTEYFEDGTMRPRSPEAQEKIKNKKLELKSLKRELKAAPLKKKDAIQIKIKALKKELKIISPIEVLW